MRIGCNGTYFGGVYFMKIQNVVGLFVIALVTTSVTFAGEMPRRRVITPAPVQADARNMPELTKQFKDTKDYSVCEAWVVSTETALKAANARIFESRCVYFNDSNEDTIFGLVRFF